MFAAKAYDERKGQLVQFPTSALAVGRITSVPALLHRLDAAHAAGDQQTAETLIGMLYERFDAAMVSKTREGGTL